MDISKSREPDIAENNKFMESIIHVVDNVEVSLPGQSGKRNAPISLQNVLQALQRHREGMYRLLLSRVSAGRVCRLAERLKTELNHSGLAFNIASLTVGMP